MSEKTPPPHNKTPKTDSQPSKSGGQASPGDNNKARAATAPATPSTPPAPKAQDKASTSSPADKPAVPTASPAAADAGKTAPASTPASAPAAAAASESKAGAKTAAAANPNSKASTDNAAASPSSPSTPPPTNAADKGKAATPPRSNTPPPAEPKSGKGLALLALLCGLGGLGTGAYALIQQSPLQQTATAAEQGALAAEKRVLETEQTLQALQQHVANAAQGLDKAEVSQLIAAALQDYAKAQPQLPNTEEIQAQIDTQIAAAMPQGLKREEVQSLIDQALLNSHSDTPVDFAQTIEAINQSNAQAQAALNSLSSRSEEIQQRLSQQADKLASELQTVADTRPNPQPLISALTLADIAAQNGDYALAEQYLAQAEKSFADFGLENSAFADYQSRISQLRGEIGGRADTFTLTARIDRIIQSIEAWPFKNPAAAQQAIAEAPIQGDTVAETAGNIGQKILNRTFKVVHNDEAGLTWIDAHKDLQTLIRENVRLDLAFARNALQLHNADAYRRNIEQLLPRIEQYFDSQDAVVAEALQQLKALAEANAAPAPDIGALIKAVQKTAQP